MPDGTPSSNEFCPSHDECYIALMNLLPRGRAWGSVDFNRTDRDTVIKQFMSGIGNTWFHFETDMCLSLDEWFCMFSTTDKDAWERDYGIPDPCDIYNNNVCAKVESGQSPTAEYLLGLLQDSGYAAVGRWLTGDDIQFPGTRSTFHVAIDPAISPAYQLVPRLNFPLGSGYKLGAIGIDNIARIECLLERYIPAHCVAETSVAGNFDPSTLGAKLLGWYNADDLAATPTLLSWPARTGGPTLVGVSATAPAVLVDPTFHLPYVAFNGTKFLRSTGTGSLPVGAVPCMVWASVSQNDTTTATTRQFFAYGAQSGQQTRRLQRAGGVGASRLNVLNTTGTAHVDIGPTEFVGACVIMGSFGTTQNCGRINGIDTFPQCTAHGGTMNTTGTSVTVGASNLTTANAFWNGANRQIVVTTDTLTFNEKLQLEGWLAWDSMHPEALPGDHPYRTIRP